ncbi:hemin ABC transporter substrate-binding protein [Alteromonas sp. KUL49]|nr:hemin ABC transporter substrate-binding protein [Alteromonas sp. KUL49]GEA11228.1 hemin ABC transporter substrate-binding protein [Alteromonas sp. KUL49]
MCFSFVVHSEEVKSPRVVAAGGSITEIIYALGQQDTLVGVDSTSVYPASAQDKPQIGYVRQLSPEGVLSLSPSLLIGESDAGPEKVIQQLTDTELQIELISEHDNFSGIEQKIQTIAGLLGAEDAGDALVDEVKADKAALSYIVNQVEEAPKVLFVLSLRGGSPIVSGAGTSAHDVINAAGAVNVASELEGWKPLSTEAAVPLNPDVIITMGRAGQHNTDKLAELPHFRFSNAVKNNRVFVVNGSFLLGMGPTTPKAVIDLATKLHPQASLPRHYALFYPPQTGE